MIQQPTVKQLTQDQNVRTGHLYSKPIHFPHIKKSNHLAGSI